MFYFSGTGNSAWVARSIASGIGEKSVRLMPDSEVSFSLSDGEPLGFVFPCYAWGVPPFIERYVRKLHVANVSYVYFVITCGDDTGCTSELFCKLLESRGWKCSMGYAVQMPESYVNLPGFDVDPADKAERKIMLAKERLKVVVSHVSNRSEGCFDTLPGRFKWIKSHVVRPLFNKVLITPKPFRASAACNACGRCVRVCPFSNVRLGGGGKEVQWGANCVLCMRCYHSCPKHAVHWGRFTKNKGQYLLSQYIKGYDLSTT